jgi:hypothetical protein
MRAVRVTWGPAASVFIDPDSFGALVIALFGTRLKWSYEWNEADEVFKFWTEDGNRFLDKVRGCKPDRVARKFDRKLRKDAELCLKNLKAAEPEWRKFVEKDGCLQIWVDGY